MSSHLRFAARQLARRPAFTITALLVLAIGIGAPTAVFSVLDTLLLRSLGLPDEDRVVFVWGSDRATGGREQQVSFEDFSDLRHNTAAFTAMAAVWIERWTLGSGGAPERVEGLQVTPDYSAVLGVRPLLGRGFLAEEGVEGNDRVVLLGERLWRTRFGADSGIVGEQVLLDEEPYTVVGVMPAAASLEFGVGTFRAAPADLWTPLTPAHFLAGNRRITTYEVVARLRPDVPIREADAALATVARRLEAEYPETNTDRTFYATPVRGQVVGAAGQATVLLFAAVGLVLLIAAANLALLLLARLAGRDRELAIRGALGATRRSIVRLTAAETGLLALGGTVLGVVFAQWMLDLMLSVPGLRLPLMTQVNLDGRVVLFAIGLAALVATVVGLLAALRWSPDETGRRLRVGGAQADPKAHRLREGLIATQMALSSTLLLAAGLMTASLVKLVGEDPGFETESVVTFPLSLPGARYGDQAAAVGFYHRLLDSLAADPRIERAAATGSLPLSGHNTGSSLTIAGRPVPAGEQPPTVNWQFVTPGYFATMGMRLREGRTFTPDDVARAPHVTIVNETLARRFFGDASPIGRRVAYGIQGDSIDWHEIVGVVGDVRHLGLDQPATPRAYDLFGQSWGLSLAVVAVPRVRAANLSARIREVVGSLDPGLPVGALTPMNELAAHTVADRRFAMLLLVGFAAGALFLTAAGIYGVVAFLVRERFPEFAIRSALGARVSDLYAAAVGRSARAVALGASVGLAGGLVSAAVLRRFLWGVTPVDPVVLAAVLALLAATTLAAMLLPARRAARIDPMEALRGE